MQVIYIDTYICVNLFIDYLILFSVKTILHIHSKGWRILLGSLFAAVSSLAVFLPVYSGMFSVFYRVFTAVSTVMISFGFISLKKLIIRSGTFFVASMVICGVVVLVEFLFHPKGVVVYNDSVYFDVSPVTLIISTLGAYIGLTVWDKLKGNNRIDSRIIRVTVYTDNKTCISFESAVDTGCKLNEPFSGLPVIMAERELLKAVNLPKEKMRIIPFSTTSGAGAVYGFKPHKLKLNGKDRNEGCYVAVCDNKINGEIKSIMGTELLDNL